jgi:hypothetical protein
MPVDSPPLTDSAVHSELIAVSCRGVSVCHSPSQRFIRQLRFLIVLETRHQNKTTETGTEGRHVTVGPRQPSGSDPDNSLG